MNGSRATLLPLSDRSSSTRAPPPELAARPDSDTRCSRAWKPSSRGVRDRQGAADRAPCRAASSNKGRSLTALIRGRRTCPVTTSRLLAESRDRSHTGMIVTHAVTSSPFSLPSPARMGRTSRRPGCRSAATHRCSGDEIGDSRRRPDQSNRCGSSDGNEMRSTQQAKRSGR